MKRFYANVIRWNLPNDKKEDVEELAYYIGHEIAYKELTGNELETELVTSYHELKELHEESNITVDEWVQWVKDGIEEYQSWVKE